MLIYKYNSFQIIIINITWIETLIYQSIIIKTFFFPAIFSDPLLYWCQTEIMTSKACLHALQRRWCLMISKTLTHGCGCRCRSTRRHFGKLVSRSVHETETQSPTASFEDVIVGHLRPDTSIFFSTGRIILRSSSSCHVA
jgi:hypothetical protein